jgi:hypothetical protein
MTMVIMMVEAQLGVHAYDDGNLCIKLFIQNVQLQRSKQCLYGHEPKLARGLE